MNDHVRQPAELEALKERWKLAATISWLLLALLVLGGASVGVLWQAQARQARMQAEFERDRAMQAEQMARQQAERALYAETVSRAQESLHKNQDLPPKLLKDVPKD
jgi:type II secretory pathway pseudopilin PulG